MVLTHRHDESREYVVTSVILHFADDHGTAVVRTPFSKKRTINVRQIRTETTDERRDETWTADDVRETDWGPARGRSTRARDSAIYATGSKWF